MKKNKDSKKSLIYLLINLFIGLIMGASVYLSTPNYLNKIQLIAWAILCIFACFGLIGITFIINNLMNKDEKHKKTKLDERV